MRTAQLVTEKAGQAVDAGIAPAAPEADPIVDELVRAFAGDRTADAAFRRQLADGIATSTDPRAERFWQLLATINGWPPIPSTTHLWTWFVEALRARV